MKIYTKTGDMGETALFGGGRVPKDHPRVAAYGDVDELNSVIGIIRATEPAALFDPLLESIQRDLFSIGGHPTGLNPSAQGCEARATLGRAPRRSSSGSGSSRSRP